MEENSKSNVTFNIYGGNNQILPNATEAVQNFYGDQFADQKLHSEGESTDAPNEDEQRLAIYINNVETLEEYVAKLSVCVSARELALVVDAMVWDSSVKVDRDTAVMQEFIRVLLPLAPHVTTGINNIRKQINNLLCKSR